MCSSDLRAAARNSRGRTEDLGKTLRALDNANKAIEESSVKEVAGFLFPETDTWEEEIALEVAAKRLSADPLNRHLEFSRRFYRALAEAAEYNLGLLDPS